MWYEQADVGIYCNKDELMRCAVCVEDITAWCVKIIATAEGGVEIRDNPL
mgnify:CR=1